MILTDVSDTINADSLALFTLNIEILLADVTKPEKSKILTLTWPVTSSVTSGSNFWPCMGSSRTGLSNGVWNLEIGPVVWEISGGGPFGPPPAGRVTIQTPAGRGLRGYISGTETPTDKRSSLVGTPIPSTVYGINAESCQYLLWYVARAARMLSQIFLLLFLGNDCAEILYALGAPLVTAYAVVTGRASLHVRTCRDTPKPRFCISETAWPIAFEFGMWVGGH